MTYPTPPGPRIAYDVDGSLVFLAGLWGETGLLQADPAFARAMNSDAPRYAVARVTTLANYPATGSYNYGGMQDLPPAHALIVRFPEPMRIRALAFYNRQGGYTSSGISGLGWMLQGYFETSTDSTNGIDGTWLPLFTFSENDMLPRVLDDTIPAQPGEMYGYVTPYGGSGTGQALQPAVIPNYRLESGGPGQPGWREMSGGATRQVTWLRFRPYAVSPDQSVFASSGNVQTQGVAYKLHLYGEPDTAADDDRLVFTDVAGNPKRFDWGDVGQGETFTQTFKVKNISDTLTANEIAISRLNPAPDYTQEPEEWITMSLDGVVWDGSVTLPTLAPGESSDTITLRLQVGQGLVGPVGPRLIAEVEEWV